MKKIIASSIAIVSLLSLSGTAYAVSAGEVRDLTSAASVMTNYLNLAITFLVAAAVAWVIWSAFKFVMSAGDEEKRAEGRSGIIYGIIGIAVMLSIWGLVRIFINTIGIESNPTHITPPTV